MFRKSIGPTVWLIELSILQPTNPPSTNSEGNFAPIEYLNFENPPEIQVL